VAISKKGFLLMRFILRRFALLFGAAILPLSFAVSHAQSVAISPGYTNVGVNGTVQYSATVTGLANTAVTWQVSGVSGGNTTNGKITTGGLYTAPAAVPANGVTITALASDKKTSAVVYVNVAAAGPTITAISPNPVTVGTYTATITGSGFKSGAMLLVGGASMTATFVNATTLKVTTYQGPASSVAFQVQNPGTLFGPAFSVPVKSASSSPQTISPTTASVNLGATKQFTSSGATSWTASAGTISSTGLYTAPATLPASTSVTVTATGPNGIATAIVTLVNTTPQLVSPTTATLGLGATQQFASTGATSWTATAGTVSSTGLYTAPASLPASGNATVTATGPNGSAAAVVTLIPPTPVIADVGNGTLPLGIFSATITGSGFIGSSVAKLNGTALTTAYSNGALNVSGFYGQSGPANITVSNGSVTSAAFPVQVGVQNALASAAAARRFLEQGAFGPTPTDATHVQTIGIPAWINEQFAMPQISNYSLITSSQGGMPQHFLTMAVSNPDQLRQRVAFALSQIFVTSIDKLIWNDNMVPFQNMLLADSFTNYRQIMGDVTLDPAMGQYLDMANNAKANPAIGSLANENYARELMQLFTTGTNMLNQDGTPILDGNGLPVPVYSQFTITEFARVYTGWTYAPKSGQPVNWGEYINGGTMVPYPAEHDMGSKQLLNGYVSPAGATPQQDLNNALDNIFNHPNLGPFVGTQLIQHLVKSNPSPAYVSRVAAAFNDNGHQVRGDMQAVIAAVLLDPEARANDEGGKDLPTDGHLQEPALFIPAMVRAFGGQMNDQNYYSGELANLGQDLFDSPSVFNYYAPDYVVPGTALMGGEFQIHTPNNAIVRANEAQSLMFSQYSNPVQNYGPGTTVDLTPFVALAATPSTLVDALDLTLTHGVMPAAMKSQIVSAVTADSGNGSVHQVQTACYLILSSSYYNVWH
jgi:uncharacterized protein (DUF1800 family)